MARKSIFDIVQENSDLSKDINRISEIVLNASCVRYEYEYYSIQKFVAKYLFHFWKARGHCVDLDDFINCLQYQENYRIAVLRGDINSVLLIIELYYNLWKLVDNCIVQPKNEVEAVGNYYLVKNIMDDCLAKLNYTTHYDQESEQLIVIEDNAAVTAVAEIVETDLALDLIRYNHYALKGDLKEKQRILKIMADAIEARKEVLKSIDSSLNRDIHNLVNNLNIRHNNVDKTSNHYHKYVADMSDEELEEWYDETYQMILLAFLRIDNVERAQKVRELSKNISEEDNG